MLHVNVTPTTLPTGLIDVKLIEGYPAYAIGYDENEASLWSCKKVVPGKPWVMSDTWTRLKPAENPGGYLQTSLTRDGKTKQTKLHILVAEAFIGPRPPGYHVRHGPRGTRCNLPSNLSYGTCKQNQADRVRDGTNPVGSRNPRARITEEQALLALKLNSMGTRQYVIAAMLGVATPTVNHICTGRTWAHLRKAA